MVEAIVLIVEIRREVCITYFVLYELMSVFMFAVFFLFYFIVSYFFACLMFNIARKNLVWSYLKVHQPMFKIE